MSSLNNTWLETFMWVASLSSFRKAATMDLHHPAGGLLMGLRMRAVAPGICWGWARKRAGR
jgi:hypothetical protein